MDDERPVVMALVGYLGEPQGLIGGVKWVSLERAEEYHRYGFSVMVDPWTLEDLTRWEQRQRSVRKWFER